MRHQRNASATSAHAECERHSAECALLQRPRPDRATSRPPRRHSSSRCSASTLCLLSILQVHHHRFLSSRWELKPSARRSQTGPPAEHHTHSSHFVKTDTQHGTRADEWHDSAQSVDAITSRGGHMLLQVRHASSILREGGDARASTSACSALTSNASLRCVLDIAISTLDSPTGTTPTRCATATWRTAKRRPLTSCASTRWANGSKGTVHTHQTTVLSAC